MKVNIIATNTKKEKSWILGKAVSILKGSDIFVENEPKADFNYYFPYLNFEPNDNKNNTCDNKNNTCLFTHYEEISEKDIKNTVKKATKFISIAKQTDYLISISKQTQTILKLKANKDSTVINFGTDKKKDIVFGVCGRVYKSGRKNEHFVKELIRLKFNVISWGDDNWGCPNFSNDYKDIDEFYKKIDYLIVTSSNEGGCVPVLEALALGVPVIAPNVGWCWEYPCYQYEKNNFLSLFKLMLCLTSPSTWDDFLKNHLLFFNYIYKK